MSTSANSSALQDKGESCGGLPSSKICYAIAMPCHAGTPRSSSANLSAVWTAVAHSPRPKLGQNYSAAAALRTSYLPLPLHFTPDAQVFAVERTLSLRTTSRLMPADHIHTQSCLFLRQRNIQEAHGGRHHASDTPLLTDFDTLR